MLLFKLFVTLHRWVYSYNASGQSTRGHLVVFYRFPVIFKISWDLSRNISIPPYEQGRLNMFSNSDYKNYGAHNLRFLSKRSISSN